MTRQKQVLRWTHLEILDRLERGQRVIELASEQFFRFPRGRVMYSKRLLDELQQAGLIAADNSVTPDGLLLLLLNRE